MKSRLFCLSVVLFASACTGSSSSDDLGLDSDLVNSSPSTSGISGEVQADELPLADADASAQANGTPDQENTEPSSGSVPLEPEQGTAAEASVEKGDVSTDTTDRDEEVAAASDAFTACAIVEAGFIAALDGEGNVTDLYARGAQAAIDSSSGSYVSLGEKLRDAAANDDASERADELLTQCAADGFERLAG